MNNSPTNFINVEDGKATKDRKGSSVKSSHKKSTGDRKSPVTPNTPPPKEAEVVTEKESEEEEDECPYARPGSGRRQVYRAGTVELSSQRKTTLSVFIIYTRSFCWFFSPISF